MSLKRRLLKALVVTVALALAAGYLAALITAPLIVIGATAAVLTVAAVARHVHKDRARAKEAAAKEPEPENFEPEHAEDLEPPKKNNTGKRLDQRAQAVVEKHHELQQEQEKNLSRNLTRRGGAPPTERKRTTRTTEPRHKGQGPLRARGRSSKPSKPSRRP